LSVARSIGCFDATLTSINFVFSRIHFILEKQVDEPNPNRLSLASLLKYFSLCDVSSLFSPLAFFSPRLRSSSKIRFRRLSAIADLLHRERTFYANPINFIFHIAGTFYVLSSTFIS